MYKFNLFFFLLLFGITIVAQPMRDDGPRMRSYRIADKLNLSPEQLHKFNEIQFEHQKKMIDLRSQLQKNRLEKHKLMNESTIDEKRLLNITESNNKINSEIRTSSIQKWLAVSKILNDDQKQLWSKTVRGDRFDGCNGKLNSRMKDRYSDKRRGNY